MVRFDAREPELRPGLLVRFAALWEPRGKGPCVKPRVAGLT